MSMQPTRANVRKPMPDESTLSPAEIEHGLREQLVKPKRERPAKRTRDLRPQRSSDGYTTKGSL